MFYDTTIRINLRMVDNRLYLVKIHMDDNCVYARSILGRMTSTYTSTFNSEGTFSDSQTMCKGFNMQPIRSILELSSSLWQ